MNAEIRLEWARAIRALDSEERASQLLADFAEIDRQEPRELEAVEQLPDWLYATLLRWQLERATPPGLEGEDLLCLRTWQLCGALAEAVEQAARLGEPRTAQRMAYLLNFAVQRAKGTAQLAYAFKPERERAPEEPRQ